MKRKSIYTTTMLFIAYLLSTPLIIANIHTGESNEFNLVNETTTEEGSRMNKSILEGFVNTLSTLDLSQYTEASAAVFRDAFEEARIILATDESKLTSTAVEDAYVKLKNAVEGLESISVSKNLLFNIITYVETELQDETIYTENSYNQVSIRFAEAKAVADNSAVTQVQVDNVVHGLLDAIQQLSKVADKSRLEAAIAEAEVFVFNKTYTADSWEFFQEALDHVKYLLKNIRNCSELDSSNGINRLNEAMVNLDPAVDKAPTLTGVDNAKQTGYQLQAYNGYLQIESYIPLQIKVYGITGQLYTQCCVQEGTTTIELLKGIHLVQLNDRIHKIVMR
ncbi:hypothetical protein [Parabacteroides sp. PF5-9]|uniref:hypothetical protein n=1 Tax=Parabacteroides sp. PF5-9 TaxID=1742404 RepID=UPI0024734D26|nr:hypothetical protein [Parabacteroides sp. PF5-9]